MDLELQIKAEPAWLEDEANTSLGNFEFVSETKPLKQETKLELPEPGPTQENTFELSADIKGEISIEQQTVDELYPHIKQENNVGDVAMHSGQEALASTVRRSKAIHHMLNVKKHIPAPSGKKPYQCTLCNKVFTTNGNLRTHMVIHSGEKPFHCKQCNKSFSRKDHLETHVLLHTDERPFHCKECNTSFSRREHLKRHLLTHSGVRRFHCKECNKSFSRKDNLRTHMLVHFRERYGMQVVIYTER